MENSIITFLQQNKKWKSANIHRSLKIFFTLNVYKKWSYTSHIEDNGSLIKLINLWPLQPGSNEKFLCQ